MKTEVNNPNEIPDNLFYHRKCYQRFTLKRDIDKLKSQHDNIQAKVNEMQVDFGNVEEPQRRTKRVCSDSTILPYECIFCKKRRTKNRKEEKLAQCIDERGRDLIIKHARRKQNFYIMSIPDLISNEAKYHKTCYQTFTLDEKEEDDIDETDIEAEAFKQVIKYFLELQTFRKNDIVTLKFLMAMMEEKLKESNSTIKPSTRKNFKRSLETKVPSIKSLTFGSEVYIYCKSASIDGIILRYIETKNENDQLKDQYKHEEAQIIKSFDVIRNEIKHLKDTLPWPPQPHDLTPDKVVIPPMLNLALSTLLKGKDDMLNEKAERLKMSIAQDLIYAVTQGISILIFESVYSMFCIRNSKSNIHPIGENRMLSFAKV